MNTNLLQKELKRNRKNLITWSLIVTAFTALVLGIFPFMSGMGDSITGLMENIPEELTKAMGMDANTWKNILGFYSTYYGIYIILLVGIFSMSTGATIISKEERDRTSEFLYTRPISRASIFDTKIGALIGLMLIIDLIQTLVAVVLLATSDTDFSWGAFTIMHIHGIVLIFFFTAMGVLISFFFRPKKNFMGPVVGVIFGSYFLNAVSKSAESIEWMGYISPFRYLDFTPLDEHYEVNWIGLSCLVAIGCLLILIARRLFLKKDIQG